MIYEQIKNKMKVGDYSLAAEMLNISIDNVRVRLYRRKADVLQVLTTIIENREKLINGFQLEEN